jgi:hypothetical protein
MTNPNDKVNTKNVIATVVMGMILFGATAALSGLNSGPQFAGAQQQTEQQQNQTQTSNATTIANTTTTDTFTANGIIAGTIPQQGGGQQSSSSPFLVGGDWSLKVDNGNVTNFRANFTMVRTDGSEHHSHDITNFKVGNNTQFQLDPKGKTTINGTADYAVNGTSKWPGSDTTITIEKARILTIQPNEQEVKQHFQGQPIYGIAMTITGENGTKIAESAPAGGNQTQQQQQGPGGVLGNITKPFQDLFGGGKK